MQINQTDEIRRFILDYLAEHPDAGDSLTGIVDQWLIDRRIKYETRSVFEVVAQLVSDGLLVETKKADSEMIYRLNKDREKAVQKMLTEMKL